MGFHEIPAKRFGHDVKLDSVYIRLDRPRLKARRRHFGPRLAVYLSADVAAACGWRAGGRVLVLFGRDDDQGHDAGKLRLLPVDAMDRGSKLGPVNHSRRLRVSTTRLPDPFRRLPACSFQADFAADAEANAGAGALTVTLPFAVFGHAVAAAELAAATRYAGGKP